jgi:hypothetical protein
MKKLCIDTPAAMGGWEVNPTLPPLDVKVNAQIQRFTAEINAPISESRKTTAGISRRRFFPAIRGSVTDGAVLTFSPIIALQK